MPVGNPADPILYYDGIFTSKCKNFSIRSSYMYNNVYKLKFEEKHKNITSTTSDIKMKLFAGVLTFNFYNFLDIYGIAGSTNLQIDQNIYTKRSFAWGAGFKSLLFTINCFQFALDGKYFSTIQKPQYVVEEKQVYPILSSYKEHLEEYQLALGASYLTKFLIPYIGVTYILKLDGLQPYFYSSLNSKPNVFFIQLPGGARYAVDAIDSSYERQVGMVLGASVFNYKHQGSLNLEVRMFDQNAFSFIGTLRF